MGAQSVRGDQFVYNGTSGKMTSGTGAPSGGTDGDFYIRVNGASSALYQRVNGSWVQLQALPSPTAAGTFLRSTGAVWAGSTLVLPNGATQYQVPFATAAERSEAEEIAPGMWRVFLRFGFAESPDVPKALAASSVGSHIAEATTSYFVGRDTVAVTTRGFHGIPRKIFALLHRHAQVSTDFFRVPPDHTITMGARVEI